MPVKNKGILIIIFGIYTRCQQMKVGDMCRKFECREDIHTYTYIYIYTYTCYNSESTKFLKSNISHISRS